MFGSPIKRSVTVDTVMATAQRPASSRKQQDKLTDERQRRKMYTKEFHWSSNNKTFMIFPC